MENKEWLIAVTADLVVDLKEADRWAKILEPAPCYEKDESAPNADKNKIKLIMNVELSDKRKAQYYPNRTVARFIATKLKTDLSTEGMKKWIGNTIYWGKIIEQNVMGNMKKCLYVTDVKLI